MMNKINVKLLKQNLTLAHHKQIMQALNIPAYSENKEQIIYFSGDKNKDALKNKDFDIIFDSAKILYVAYLCGLNDNMKEALSEEDFLEELPMDFALVNTLAAELIQPKKK